MECGIEGSHRRDARRGGLIASDEAKGICRHVKEDLGVHHSPDLLHVQAEVVKATSAPLASKTRQVENVLEEAEKAVNSV